MLSGRTHSPIPLLMWSKRIIENLYVYIIIIKFIKIIHPSVLVDGWIDGWEGGLMENE